MRGWLNIVLFGLFPPILPPVLDQSLRFQFISYDFAFTTSKPLIAAMRISLFSLCLITTAIIQAAAAPGAVQIPS